MPQTKLNPDDELRFQNWYKVWAIRAGIDPNPDNPLHKYDYRAAYKAKVVPTIDPSDNRYHWPSTFKHPDHPNRFVKGVDTITGKLVPIKPPQQEPTERDILFGGKVRKGPSY